SRPPAARSAEGSDCMNRLMPLSACLLVTLPASASAFEPAATKPTFAGAVAPFLNKHCTSCHSGAKAKGGVVLDLLAKSESDIVRDKALWEKVADTLRTGDMPPAHKARPTEAELDGLHRWLDSAVFQFDCTGARDPGRVTVRRLNRAEYNNTIRDLT